jgi:hypothetical protein
MNRTKRFKIYYSFNSNKQRYYFRDSTVFLINFYQDISALNFYIEKQVLEFFLINLSLNT